MKIALISDVHGNLPALESALASIAIQGVDDIICLGDVVGYGAEPNECVAVIRESCSTCLMGNHDEAAAGLSDSPGNSDSAIISNQWTRSQLTFESKRWLAGLPRHHSLESALLTHANPEAATGWEYIQDYADAKRAFRHFTERLCFVGHTHIPVYFTDEKSGRKLINVGSVGQPRDGDARACYCLFDTVDLTFTWVRVAYPIEKAAQKIIDAGLPASLASRLFRGH